MLLAPQNVLSVLEVHFSRLGAFQFWSTAKLAGTAKYGDVKQFLGPRSSGMTLLVPSARQASQCQSLSLEKSPGYSQHRDLSSPEAQEIHTTRVRDVSTISTLSSDLGAWGIVFGPGPKLRSHRPSAESRVQPQIF